MGQHERVIDSLNWMSKHFRDPEMLNEFNFDSDNPLASARELHKVTAEQGGESFEEDTLQFLENMPDVVADVITRVARTGIKNGRQVRWAWKPGYDFELNITQARTGNVTVIVTSPYPDELPPFNPQAG